MDVRLPESTFSDVETPREGVRSLWIRRGVLVLLALTLLAGAVGVMGVRSVTTSATQQPWTLELTYAGTARAGLDVPWEVRARREGGFDGPVTLAVTGSYFDIFETQAFHPQPSASWRDAEVMYLEFDPPPGEVFVLAYDAYIQPASQRGADGSVSVVEDGLMLATVDFDTRLWP